ncbi:MAG TPA: SDR family NAD(P)-dependent oxidoreductase [Candidatus Baltobacteraceae bacterium]|nr:SDR family NAD(P)-dependent oxidoreductase [Candidatus Baltobacteraceae bacterium]
MPNSRVVIVTGAGSGIGRQIALSAARAGYTVVAVSKEPRAADEAVAEIVNDGGRAVALTIDVTQPDAPVRIVELAKARFGRIDVLVNNAGFATSGGLLDQSDAQIDAQWQVHVAAPLRIARTALPLLRESGGQILFIGSGLSRVPAPFYGAYCAAKAGIRTAAVQLRRELFGMGIAVTFVDPGSVRTNFAKSAGIAAHGERWTISPQKVAQSIVRSFTTRQPQLRVAPMHSLIAMLGEWFPRATDRALQGRTEAASQPAPENFPTPAPAPQPPPAPQPAAQGSDLERALSPVARRMERVKLPASFLAELLETSRDVHLSDAAMRWAGMPNKNERAAMAEALDALAAGGFLERTGDETWRVVRSVQ